MLCYSRKGNYANAMKFYNYISSPEARKVLKQFGYQVL
jgi:ABC-type molybdate transport system substrate-binding protein